MIYQPFKFALTLWISLPGLGLLAMDQPDKRLPPHKNPKPGLPSSVPARSAAQSLQPSPVPSKKPAGRQGQIRILAGRPMERKPLAGPGQRLAPQAKAARAGHRPIGIRPSPATGFVPVARPLPRPKAPAWFRCSPPRPTPHEQPRPAAAAGPGQVPPLCLPFSAKAVRDSGLTLFGPGEALAVPDPGAGTPPLPQPGDQFHPVVEAGFLPGEEPSLDLAAPPEDDGALVFRKTLVRHTGTLARPALAVLNPTAETLELSLPEGCGRIVLAQPHPSPPGAPWSMLSGRWELGPGQGVRLMPIWMGTEGTILVARKGRSAGARIELLVASGAPRRPIEPASF